MPVIKYEHNSGYSWAIWEIGESEDDLLALSTFNTDEKQEFSLIKHPIKRLEFLAGRLVLKEILTKNNEAFQGIYKDDCGKPHLINGKNSISLSHSFPFAGAVMHLGQFSGIDIEKPKSKLYKIAHKFLSEEEKQFAGMDEVTLCIYWCAKETLYKIYGRKQVIFSKNLMVERFTTQLEGIIQGRIILPQHTSSYQLRYLQLDSHIICFNI